MSRNTLLIASREFRQIARTRSFWITLLILPAMLALTPFLSKLIDPPFEQTVMLIDRSTTGAGEAIAARIAFEQQRSNLAALADFAKGNDLADIAPGASWTRKTGWYGDAQVAKFIAEGGMQAALAAIRARAPEAAGRFKAPRPAYRLLPMPRAVADAPFDTLATALAPQLKPPKESGRKPVDYVLAIPADFGAQPAVRLWTNGQPRTGFIALVQAELTHTLRTGFLQRQGLAPPVAQIANRMEPAIGITRPAEGSGREKLIIQSILPVAMTYLLLMALIMSGQWMLQSSIEERSSKLIEAVIACASPHEFMHGKLIGTIAIGLVMVLTWVACGLFAGFATQGVVAELIRPALEPLASPTNVIAILFFFLAGFVMVSLIFLTIGAMSESMQDAQGFLVPTMLVLMLPVVVLMQLVISGTDSIVVKAMTWIPLFAPFAVLARLGSGIATWEIVGSGAVLIAFIALEFVLLGRVFRASLLSGNGRPSFKAVARSLRQA
jgi:ABC-2 type transport system permease protein